MGKTVMVIGLGSLGRKLIGRLLMLQEAHKIIVVSRSARAGAWCAVHDYLGTGSVLFEACDALNVSAVSRLLKKYRPDLVVQAGALLSPFVLDRTRHREVASRAGFALQLPAQLPLILAVMRAVRGAGVRCPVVNCSFPDATHPILEKLELAPTVGIGNVAILQRLAEHRLEQATGQRTEVRLVAHHAHTVAILKRRDKLKVEPKVVSAEGRLTWEDCVPLTLPPMSGEDINRLTAAVALPLLQAMLDPRVVFRASAPGPAGLPGGYPVVVRDSRVELELGCDAQRLEAIALCEEAAKADGIAEIGPEGSVRFTDEYCRVVSPFSKSLCEPLPPDAALSRLGELRCTFGVQ